MWPNPQFPTDLVTFTEEILNGKLHFLCSLGYFPRIQPVQTSSWTLTYPAKVKVKSKCSMKMLTLFSKYFSRITDFFPKGNSCFYKCIEIVSGMELATMDISTWNGVLHFYVTKSIEFQLTSVLPFHSKTFLKCGISSKYQLQPSVALFGTTECNKRRTIFKKNMYLHGTENRLAHHQNRAKYK